MEEQMNAKAKKQMRMTVQGMTCDDCNHHVAHALETAGATNARADYRRSEAVFTLAGDATAAPGPAAKHPRYPPGPDPVLRETNRPPPPPTGRPHQYDAATGRAR